MSISVFDLFKIGIGPSSSHTVGPMVAANTFLEGLNRNGLLNSVKSITVDLYGSLGATGKGHGSGKAIILGLMGEKPDKVNTDEISSIMAEIIETKKISLNKIHIIDFDYETNVIFHRKKSLPFHANGMMISANDSNGSILYNKIYYSVGGGFIVDDSDRDSISSPIKQNDTVLPYPFSTGDELLALCKKEKLSISEIMIENEKAWLPEKEIRKKLLSIWQVMQDCVKAGCKNTGTLPGGLKVQRRAAELSRSLENQVTHEQYKQGSMDWVNLFALAVNEENAAGGRIVTAPTNGAAGIIPALIHYYVQFCNAYKKSGEDGVIRFLLTAAAIGIIIKENASISGAEVGCQGEIGSACAMAAAGLTEVLGGTPEQIENAAEIGIEHNLGLTCDPIGGLVQIPCIERNAMGSIKAINASRLALRGNGQHFVSLDKVIITMRETGKDMRSKYKETSRGGLAIQVVEVPVNITEC